MKYSQGLYALEPTLAADRDWTVLTSHIGYYPALEEPLPVGQVLLSLSGER